MSDGGAKPTARAIGEKLSDRIDRLALQLLPRGRPSPGRRSWRCGSLSGEEGSALCVWLAGAKRGRWRDYKSGDGGDALSLVAAVLFRGDIGQALGWARDWLGIGRLDAGTAQRLDREAAESRVRRQRQADREALANAQSAKLVWLAGSPIEPHDAAWRYFRGRGVDLAALPYMPRSLRLHPELWNPESRRAWPALVAAICAPGGAHVNTHRIWLEPLADGRVRKAPLERAKLSMPGGYPGGCVRLLNGGSGKAWKDMPEGETLAAGEGIEDTLTIAQDRHEWRYAAVLSASNLGGLVLPPQVTRLVWIGQNDPRTVIVDGERRVHPARRALAAGLKTHRAAGRETLVIRPPRDVKDVNELAQALAGDADEALFPPFLASGREKDEMAAVSPPPAAAATNEVAWPV